jgi:LacI family transcriptional regulator
VAVTISDLAKHLGLSVSTVSKALNGYSDVADTTREVVLAASQELNYQPRSAARTLRLQRTEKLGILHPLKGYESEAFISYFRGVAKAAESCGYSLISYAVGSDPARSLERICRAREVDAMMVISLGLGGVHPLHAALAVLNAENVLHIVVGQPVYALDPHPLATDPLATDPLATDEAVAYVAPDNHAAARALTEHLLAAGHTRFGYLSRRDDTYNDIERQRAIETTLERAGKQLEPTYLSDAPYAPYSGHAAMQRLLELPEPPTAVIAFNDHVAIDAIHAAQAQQVRVPEDIAVVGVDNIPSARIITPTLTTVDIPMRAMGEYAASWLLGQLALPPLARSKVLQKTFAVELVVRTSSCADSSEGVYKDNIS